MMPAIITPHVKAIAAPEKLRGLRAWLMWRYEHHDGEEKPRKVPYYVNGARRFGAQGSPEDKAKLTTFEAAKATAARRGFDGVGFAVLSDWGVVALDFDNCVSGGRIDPEVERITAGTYAEYSPSGHGIRAFMTGALDNAKSHAEPGRFGFEVFSSKGFVTFTGNVTEVCELVGAEDTLTPISDAVRALHTARFGRRRERDDLDDIPMGVDEGAIREALAHLDPSMGYADWLRVGMALHHETQGAGFGLWDEWSSTGEQYPGTEALEPHWDSFGRHSGPAVTMRSLLHMAREAGYVEEPSTDGFEDLGDAAPEAPKPLKFRFQTVEEFCDRPPPEWIVHGVLPAASLAVVYGDSNSGKTFFILDMALAIQRGLEWRGLRTRQRQVAYVCAEGASGFTSRLRAYAHHNDTTLGALGMRVLGDAPSLMDEKDAAEVTRGILAFGGADVVVVDTLSRVLHGGNENDAVDMNLAVRHCDKISRALGGALVILIHHTGKDASKGARGSSTLRAAADAEISVEDVNGRRVATITKQKDGENGAAFGFELVPVVYGLDDEGNDIVSCVVGHTDDVPAKVRGRKLGARESLLLTTLHDLIGLGAEWADEDELLERAAEQMPHDPAAGKRDVRRQNLKASLRALIDAGVVERGSLGVRQTVPS